MTRYLTALGDPCVCLGDKCGHCDDAYEEWLLFWERTVPVRPWRMMEEQTP